MSMSKNVKLTHYRFPHCERRIAQRMTKNGVFQAERIHQRLRARRRHCGTALLSGVSRVARPGKSRRMTEEIAAASLDQQKVNTEIILSMNDAMQLGGEMVEAVREVSGGIRGFHQDVERLQKEMEFFRTEENAVLESEAVADQNVLKGIRRHAVLAANGAA